METFKKLLTLRNGAAEIKDLNRSLELRKFLMVFREYLKPSLKLLEMFNGHRTKVIS